MLGQLPEKDEERVELRLLSDPAFTEEFDIVVDEMAALYVSDLFKGEEKKRVEEHFLKSPDRQNKVQFMSEFLRQIANERPQDSVNEPPAVVAPKPGLMDRLRVAWRNPSPALRTAAALPILVILVGLVWWFLPGKGSKPGYASVELVMTTAERSSGTPVEKVHLDSGTGELRIKLQLPDQTPDVMSYRVKLRGGKAGEMPLPVLARDAHSLTVAAPADQLSRGSYAIELTAVSANGVETPLRGAYLFAVE